MKALASFLSALAIAIALGLIAYVAFIRTGEYLKIAQDSFTLDVQKVKNDAIDGCFKNATLTNSSAGVAKVEPSMELYELCLNDKGFGVTIK